MGKLKKQSEQTKEPPINGIDSSLQHIFSSKNSGDKKTTLNKQRVI
jgi:hypothetical protein